MCPSFLKELPATSKYLPAPAVGLIHRDVDSLVCTFCGKRRHEAQNCHKWEKMLKKLAKRAPLGASASNQWDGDFANCVSSVFASPMPSPSENVGVLVYRNAV